tara:strand:+ start:730 stop:1677 length:948 start_codon:yes stop_codon:yes gene_type:complete
MALPYILQPKKDKTSQLLEIASQDPYFAELIHDLVDFGYEIKFPFFGQVGLYVPHSISTEHLDTPEKQQAFANGFVQSLANENAPKAKFRLCASLGANVNAHTFLHEIMHFYQDMLGLYLIPLLEQGVYPAHLDLQSFVNAFLFCEAWAQTEAICASWRLKEKGINGPWLGAMASADWRDLAKQYEGDQDATAIFNAWYDGKHRGFYEKHAGMVYVSITDSYERNAPKASKDEIGEALRKLELPMLLIKIPKKKMPHYLKNLDWTDKRYTAITNKHVELTIKNQKDMFRECNNTDIQDIKIGTPPYLWNRLRGAG